MTNTGRSRAEGTGRLDGLAGGQGVKKEQDAGGDQGAADHQEKQEGQGVDQRERGHLQEQACDDEQAGPADRALDGFVHLAFPLGVQKVASFSVPTS
jgi:hypothetical protein